MVVEVVVTAAVVVVAAPVEVVVDFEAAGAGFEPHEANSKARTGIARLFTLIRTMIAGLFAAVRLAEACHRTRTPGGRPIFQAAPTTAAFRRLPPMDPSKAELKLKVPPSEA